MAHGNTVLLSCFNIQVCCLYSALALLPHEQGSAINFHQSVCLFASMKRIGRRRWYWLLRPFWALPNLFPCLAPLFSAPTNQPTHPSILAFLYYFPLLCVVANRRVEAYSPFQFMPKGAKRDKTKAVSSYKVCAESKRRCCFSDAACSSTSNTSPPTSL